MMNERKTVQTCEMRKVWPRLEYLPISSDPERRVFVPGVQEEAEPAEGFGPLTTLVLGLGRWFSTAAVFAAFVLMMLMAKG